MTLYQAFRDGGAGMFPVLGFGSVLVVTSVKYALRPESRMVPLLLSLGVLTLLSGCLGFTMGIMTTLRAASQLGPDQHTVIAMLGFAESLHDLALALILMTMSTLATVIGAYRLALRAARVATTA
jgi:hypothetical protein